MCPFLLFHWAADTKQSRTRQRDYLLLNHSKVIWCRTNTNYLLFSHKKRRTYLLATHDQCWRSHYSAGKTSWKTWNFTERSEPVSRNTTVFCHCDKCTEAQAQLLVFEARGGFIFKASASHLSSRLITCWSQNKKYENLQPVWRGKFFGTCWENAFVRTVPSSLNAALYFAVIVWGIFGVTMRGTPRAISLCSQSFRRQAGRCWALICFLSSSCLLSARHCLECITLMHSHTA